MKGIGEDEDDREKINDDDKQEAGLDLESLPVGVADDDEPVERDDGHRQRGDVDGYTLQ